MLLLFVFDLKSPVDVVLCMFLGVPLKCFVVASLFYSALFSKKDCISRINLFHTVALFMAKIACLLLVIWRDS